MEILGIPLFEFIVSGIFVLGFVVLAVTGYRLQASYWKVTLAARRAQASAAGNAQLTNRPPHKHHGR
ncbi:MAG: hypothetical protein IMX01_06125 [Limnochordaceae bacterium]|nr:hypothetical protein [Limnochordaceae bacterium]